MGSIQEVKNAKKSRDTASLITIYCRFTEVDSSRGGGVSPKWGGVEHFYNGEEASWMKKISQRAKSQQRMRSL